MHYRLSEVCPAIDSKNYHNIEGTGSKNGNRTSYCARFNCFSGKEFLFDGPPWDAADLFGRDVAVDGGGQRLVAAVGTVVRVRGLPREARAVPVHALLAADPAVVQVAVRRVMFDEWSLFYHYVLGERTFGGRVGLVLKVFYGSRSVGVERGPPVGLLSY